MKLTDKENNRLQKEIDHILDSGANSIRLLEMFNNFLINRDNNKSETVFCNCAKPWGINIYGAPTCAICERLIKML